jgi:hypothetical protein
MVYNTPVPVYEPRRPYGAIVAPNARQTSSPRCNGSALRHDKGEAGQVDSAKVQ